MRLLNGWQRAWVLLMALWALPVFGYGYALKPDFIYHNNNEKPAEIVSRMTTKTWKGDDCTKEYKIELSNGRRLTVRTDWFDQFADLKEPRVDLDATSNPINLAELKKILQRMLDAGEPEDNIKLVIRHYAAQQIVWVHVPLEGSSQEAVLCFSKELPQTEMERISADYRGAYASALKAKRWRHAGWVLTFWLLPGVFLYALGYGVAWVRRGFRQEKTQ